MSDTAKGPLSGYLFQFEKALLLLSNLENTNDYISIEDVDDIATHKEVGTVIITVQAKHSISNSGTTFEDTSFALWRTIQIWIEKLKVNIFTDETIFSCATNKKIPATSLLYVIKDQPFDAVLREINTLLISQKAKLTGGKKDPSKGQSIKKVIELIEFALANQTELKKIKNNLKIEDEENLKDQFLNKLHLSSKKYSRTQIDSIFDEFFGWIINNSFSRWKNGDEAKITKDNFNEKNYLVLHSPSIVNAVFRTKELLGSIDSNQIVNRRKDVFVKQIEDINRRKDAKERIIKAAILDFIYSDIELAYLIKIGDFTDSDFIEFLEQCQTTWQTCFDEHIINEIDAYTEAEKNLLAIKIYDKIMDNIEIKFKSDFSFNSGNKYIRNGSFLKLSNVPTIGWHPEWENKYKITHESE